MQTTLLSNTDNMNYIGYINKAQYFEHATEIINLMKGHGCVNIHIEETKDKKRIEWCKFIDSLSNGDSAVFASFDNVLAGYSVKEIMERTGYRGKSNIYRILHQYDIEMEYPSMSRTANKVREKSI